MAALFWASSSSSRSSPRGRRGGWSKRQQGASCFSELACANLPSLCTRQGSSPGSVNSRHASNLHAVPPGNPPSDNTRGPTDGAHVPPLSRRPVSYTTEHASCSCDGETFHRHSITDPVSELLGGANATPCLQHGAPFTSGRARCKFGQRDSNIRGVETPFFLGDSDQHCLSLNVFLCPGVVGGLRHSELSRG